MRATELASHPTQLSLTKGSESKEDSGIKNQRFSGPDRRIRRCDVWAFTRLWRYKLDIRIEPQSWRIEVEDRGITRRVSQLTCD